MKKLVALVLILPIPAIAQNAGPLPQTGLERPDIVKGAKESGAMQTRKEKATTGANGRPKDGKHPGKPAPDGPLKPD
jgi:hypothetical protein